MERFFTSPQTLMQTLRSRSEPRLNGPIREIVANTFFLEAFKVFLGKEKQIMYGVWYGSILLGNR